MQMNFKNYVLAIVAASGLSVTALTAMTAPASARVVCDYDGDDCWRADPGYYDPDRRGDWHERREWEERRVWRERRERERWYWNQRRWDRPYSDGSLWFNF